MTQNAAAEAAEAKGELTKVEEQLNLARQTRLRRRWKPEQTLQISRSSAGS